MATRVGFLRAVNLGKRTVSMARLAEITRALGHDNVWTHINSGNVVFDATCSRAVLERDFETALEAAFGFEVTTFVRTVTEIRRTLSVEPFTVVEGDTYFITFLKALPSKDQATELEALSNDYDSIVVTGRDVHWRMHGSSIDTTLPAKKWDAIVGKLCSTSRNVNMLRKLVAKIEAKAG